MFSNNKLGTAPHPLPNNKDLKLLSPYKLFSIIFPLTTGASKIVSLISFGRLKSVDQKYRELNKVNNDITNTVRTKKLSEKKRLRNFFLYKNLIFLKV